ncbi:EGF-like repeat and discoidin I-like domain-containing protein 3 isoform X2 [Mya arenaria]|uniref:EGF-like repeat and discoidin I-like domain-containing protein 3 isoform X2 n=1 Tax=Mya arenaria TaxID=6604 RepID=UPI0022E1213C|nr:EGF-like repeat and discoidin I-like domain-containing protein 3 isoform X2 [Mya arenaria]XP_052814868.1 EGF-like repeat and discoidin I-like domain-containing protein 3 isoform X2 [Mya arenaria]
MTAYPKYRTILCLWNIFVWLSIYHVLGIHFDACLDENYPDGTIFVKVSLEQCKEHCAVRNWCKVLAYRRLFTLCTLYREEDIISKLDGDEEMKVKSCVYITREELNLQESLTCDNLCPSYPATCDIADQKCYKDDCPRFNDPNGVVRGNMNRNQSKVSVKCNWKMLDGRSTYTTTCEAGTWSENHRCINVSTCSNYIGALVPDSSLTASSMFRPGCAPNNSRLNIQEEGDLHAGAWCANASDQSPYIQIKLNTPSFVRGVATQGRNFYDPAQYVTEYQVSFSEDCEDFQDVMNETNQPMIFEGNTDKDTVVIHMFEHWVKTRCVRISPKSHVRHISLRFDVIGCPDWNVMFIGIPSRGGLVEDWLTTGFNTTSDLSCFYEGNEHNCSLHYRNPLVDKWTELHVSMVKYALYKNGNEVAYVIFNATGSNVTSWFQSERILNSSWTGLSATADFIEATGI